MGFMKKPCISVGVGGVKPDSFAESSCDNNHGFHSIKESKNSLLNGLNIAASNKGLESFALKIPPIGITLLSSLSFTKII